MNKAQFVQHIASQHDIKQQDANALLNMFLASVESAIKESKEITLIGFGKFVVKDTKVRVGHNPQTKEKIIIPAHKRVSFKAGTLLKNAANGE